MAFLPAIGAVVSLIGTVAGTAVSMVGAREQASAQKQAALQQAQMAQYQAQVAQNNAKMMSDNAAYERQKGMADAEAADMKARGTMGAIDAAQGASGFDLSSGSLTNTRSSAAELSRLDTLTTVGNANRRARDFDISATNYLANKDMDVMQSNLDISTAQNAQKAGSLNAFSSLISGATSFGTRFADFGKSGVFSGLM